MQTQDDEDWIIHSILLEPPTMFIDCLYVYVEFGAARYLRWITLNDNRVKAMFIFQRE